MAKVSPNKLTPCQESMAIRFMIVFLVMSIFVFIWGLSIVMENDDKLYNKLWFIYQSDKETLVDWEELFKSIWLVFFGLWLVVGMVLPLYSGYFMDISAVAFIVWLVIWLWRINSNNPENFAMAGVPKNLPLNMGQRYHVNIKHQKEYNQGMADGKAGNVKSSDGMDMKAAEYYLAGYTAGNLDTYDTNMELVPSST
jgi:hypothetical protein